MMDEPEFTFREIHMPWETLPEKREREERERETGERWTPEFIARVRMEIEKYEQWLNGDDISLHYAAIPCISQVKRNIPYHMRAELFDQKLLEVD